MYLFSPSITFRIAIFLPTFEGVLGVTPKTYIYCMRFWSLKVLLWISKGDFTFKRNSNFCCSLSIPSSFMIIILLWSLRTSVVLRWPHLPGHKAPLRSNSFHTLSIVDFAKLFSSLLKNWHSYLSRCFLSAKVLKPQGERNMKLAIYFTGGGTHFFVCFISFQTVRLL